MAKRKKLERFTEEELNELLTAPATRGLEKVLRFEIPRPAEAEEAAVPSNPGAPTTGASTTGAPSIGAPVVGAPVLDAPLPAVPEYILPRQPRVREARTVQDGHTQGEQLVYETLYRLAKPFHGDTRALTIGVRTLAPLVPMTYNNCQANLRSLIQKLAIEDRPASNPNNGRTYIVYGYREILQRRKSAGLTHVIRNTRGARFINSDAPAFGAPAFHPGAPNPGAPELNAGAPDLGNTGAPALDTHKERNLLLRNTTTPAVIVQALHSALGTSDDDAARRIIADSRDKAPDATAEEIAHFIRTQAERIRRMRGIENPIGLLIRQVPKCFEGESFRQFRELERQRREAEARQNAELRADAERILADPAAERSEKDWARMILESIA